MNILITGATGFIGQYLCPVLAEQGHTLTVVSRDTAKAQKILGDSFKYWNSLEAWGPETSFDIVINLAGASIAGGLWTPSRKQILKQSRIGITQKLVEKIAQSSSKPKLFLSGSAIGFYGSTSKPTTETGLVGTDFLGDLSQQWEEAARKAGTSSTRVVLMRTGLVLGKGGLLQKMLPAFRFGLGAQLGGGKQWMSWIHMEDFVQAVLHIIAKPEISGPVNMTAPAPIQNLGFTQMLNRILRKKGFPAIPEKILRIALGEMAIILVEGQHVLPQVLQQSGFIYRYPTLESCLFEILSS